MWHPKHGHPRYLNDHPVQCETCIRLWLCSLSLEEFCFSEFGSVFPVWDQWCIMLLLRMLIMLWVSVRQMCRCIQGDEQIRRHDGLPGKKMCGISASRGHWSKLHDFFTCLVCGRIGASGCQWFGTTYDDPLAFGIGKDSWQSSNGNGAMVCQQKTCNQLLYPRFSGVLFKDPFFFCFGKREAFHLQPTKPGTRISWSPSEWKIALLHVSKISRPSWPRLVLRTSFPTEILTWYEMVWCLCSDVFREKWHQDRFFCSKEWFGWCLRSLKDDLRSCILGRKCWQTQERTSHIQILSMTLICVSHCKEEVEQFNHRCLVYWKYQLLESIFTQWTTWIAWDSDVWMFDIFALTRLRCGLFGVFGSF